MRVLTAIAVLLLAFSGPGLAASSSTKTSTDGSLVLEGQDRKPATASKESLSVLLAKEIDVFIFRHQTRIWPRSATGMAASSQVSKPELEAHIQKYARMYGVDPSLVRAVMRHESGFNPRAVSPKGAQGLMQLMPGTADLMGVSNPFDPEQNIAGGVGYLKYCLNRFNNDLALALAAYNAGPERVAKTGGIPPIPETQAYVQNVLSTYTGRPQPAAPAKGAQVTTPGDARHAKIIKGPTAANPAKSEPEEGKPRRRGPRIIEVRYSSQKSR